MESTNTGLPETSEAAPPVTGTYRTGTLVYTRAGLFALFFWLLAGDFVFTLMELLQPTLLPLLLRKHGATNEEIAIIVTTIASVLNSVINPIISYRSDRTRSRFGRRIPYLAWATPFAAVFLALIPFAPEIAGILSRSPVLARAIAHLPISPVLLACGLIVVLFQTFNMVISSIYFYLFRDVVPLEHIGRAWALFRVFGYLATFCFNYWIFAQAERHLKEIFIAVSLLYAVGFLLMCRNVREGQYPPVEDADPHAHGLATAIRNFLSESFAPIYCWTYATRLFMSMYLIVATFSVFFARDQLHLDLRTIGNVTAWPALFCLPLAYPFGMLLDRWGAIRSVSLTVIAMTLANLLAFFFVSNKEGLLAFGIVIGAAWYLYMIGQSVLLQTIFHQSRLGQLSSANSILIALAGVVIAPACGKFFDWIHDYRYIYIWTAFFGVLAAFSLSKVRQHWHRCGGPDDYRAPLYNRQFSSETSGGGEA